MAVKSIAATIDSILKMQIYVSVQRGLHLKDYSCNITLISITLTVIGLLHKRILNSALG